MLGNRRRRLIQHDLTNIFEYFDIFKNLKKLSNSLECRDKSY